MEFPVYFSLYSTPGFDVHKLKSFGFEGDYELFRGRNQERNNLMNIKWGTQDKLIAGPPFICSGK